MPNGICFLYFNNINLLQLVEFLALVFNEYTQKNKKISCRNHSNKQQVCTSCGAERNFLKKFDKDKC